MSMLDLQIKYLHNTQIKLLFDAFKHFLVTMHLFAMKKIEN